jgi:predicted component of type VI protein secretion system
MPSYHLWAGNPDAVALVLKLHFGYDFEIVENVPASFPIPGRLQSRLGSPSAVLGRDALVGRSFTEFDSSYEVVVKGVPPADIAQLLPGGELRRKVEWVLDICMPNNLDYRIEVKSRSRQNQLGDKDQTVILGFTAGL